MGFTRHRLATFRQHYSRAKWGSSNRAIDGRLGKNVGQPSATTLQQRGNHPRFDLRLKKEDKYWAYIQLEPKAKEIRAELRDMEIVLDQKTHFVRQYRLVHTNGNRTIMDFQKIEINPIPPITLESISKGLPKGFKEIYIPIS